MNLSIKNKLILSLAIVLAIVSAIQTWLTVNELKATTSQEVSASLDTLSSSAAAGIQKWLDARKQITASAKDAFAKEGKPRDFLSQSMNSGNFDLVYVGTSEGKLFDSKPTPWPDGYDPRARPWYQQAQSAGKLIVTPPYEDASTGEMVITIAEPFSKGGISGVLGADVSIAAVIKDVLSIQKKGTYAFLVNKDGLIVAHPDKNLNLKQITEMASGLSAGKIKELSSIKQPAEIEIDDQDSLLKIKEIQGSNWYLGLVVDSSEAFASVSQLTRDSIIFSIIQFLIVLGIASLVINKLFRPIHVMSEALEDLSKGNGDLTQRLNIQSQDEVGTLASHVNAFVEKLHKMVGDISDSSGQLDEQSKASNAVADKTSMGLSTQQNEISQIATAVHEMSATANEVAANAELTADAARNSADSCEQGKEVIVSNQQSITSLASQVESTSNIILELEQNTQEINTILSTIQGIAEQTNLLALNAAIEAARAGEQGRGFAVVADEVRVLSQRTHSSTEEIRSMIETLQKNTQNAVHTMKEGQELAQGSVEEANNATLALEQITESINQITDMATQISSAAEEQRAVTDEVSRNLQAVKDVSDALSAEAENSSNLSQELRSISRELNDQVGQFKI
ncbi:methyl-accepting chemotaxis protein [Dongshaea marina]|uniref:methyl-accepting chemotaxis protein n=1 Tax=Dongshaea marina TaxID=2047966 RepID=UPI000D3E5CDF|nr:methyl-accepting chemotaxis protein [Dongshaea marina]